MIESKENTTGIASAAVGKNATDAASPATNSYTATFKRTEKKYCLNTAQAGAIMAHIEKHMQPDEYSNTVVNSLYLDTPDNRVIRRSLEKPLYKEKLRIRAYSCSQSKDAKNSSEQYYVELKVKYKGVVYKRRLVLSAQDARAFIGGEDIQKICASRSLLRNTEDAAARSLPRNAEGVECAEETSALTSARSSLQELQVAREISAFFTRYNNLQPSMITRCTRNAYKDENSDLRITFDKQLVAGHPAKGATALSFQIAKPEMQLIAPDQVIMEVKQAGGLPLWLARALSANKIYPQSFSKYGTAYEKELELTCNKKLRA